MVLVAQWYPVPVFGSGFPCKVTNPKRVPSLENGYWATKASLNPVNLMFAVGTPNLSI